MTELVEGALMPKGCYFMLSRPDVEAMKTYIQEAFEQGIIILSTSLIFSGFFFVKKKNGSLWPCIGYRALNAITCKCREPLPLFYKALESLQSSQIFIKLDHCSVYSLIPI